MRLSEQSHLYSQLLCDLFLASLESLRLGYVSIIKSFLEQDFKRL